MPEWIQSGRREVSCRSGRSKTGLKRVRAGIILTFGGKEGGIGADWDLAAFGMHTDLLMGVPRTQMLD